MNVKELRLNIIRATWITEESPSFQPPSWPPPPDWPVSEDKDGNVLSRYGDHIWDLSPWSGRSFKLNFGDGPVSRQSDPIDAANANLLREAITYRLWGPRPIQAAATVLCIFSTLRKIFVVCSKEGILASDLMRFPEVQKLLIKLIPRTAFDTTITELHRLLDASRMLTFEIADADFIKRLASENPGRSDGQTFYIPPRIWKYQLSRLRECIVDYNAHSKKVKECFDFCLNAYVHNFGSLEAALVRGDTNDNHLLPFANKKDSEPGRRSGYKFYQFDETARKLGILDLLEHWVGRNEEGVVEIRAFSSYLNLVQHASTLYISNFTLQRSKETDALRTDCLYFENDKELGRIAVICGETTKTDPDSDARWPTSLNVEVAVEAATHVARLRMKCAKADPRVQPTDEDVEHPYLVNKSYEPWSASQTGQYSIRSIVPHYASILRRYPKLLDPEQIKITEEDLRIARMITPTIKEDELKVGMPWPFAKHQLRRTTTVNMFSSGMLSDSSIQYILKHLTKLQSLYYGRGHTKLALNKEAEEAMITTMYEMLALQVLTALSDRFVSPHGPKKKNEIVVNMISERDAKQLAKAGRKGELSVKENVLGLCTARTACTYGGYESIARCSGGDGFKPCIDVLYDTSKKPQIIVQLDQIKEEMAVLPDDSPRYQALLVDKNGMENVLNVINRAVKDS